MGLRSIDNIGFEDGKGPAAMAGDEFELGFGEGGSEVGPVYPTNFPAGLKLWYVEPLMLNDSEKRALKMFLDVTNSATLATILNLLFWIGITILKINLAWVQLIICFLSSILTTALLWYTYERTFYGMWQRDMKVTTTALCLQGVCTLIIFLNSLLGWTYFNGWLRLLNTPAELVVRDVWRGIAVAFGILWTLIFVFSLFTIRALFVYRRETINASTDSV